MKARYFIFSLLFCLPLILVAGNKKISKNKWEGTASFYHNMFEGRRTASGQVFRQKKLTAACNHLPLGTRVRVTNLSNGKTVIVKNNDRMHKRLTHKRLLDLSREGARQLGFIQAGLAKVQMEVLPRDKKKS